MVEALGHPCRRVRRCTTQLISLACDDGCFDRLRKKMARQATNFLFAVCIDALEMLDYTMIIWGKERAKGCYVFESEVDEG
ncbi:hypothetical protein E2562_018733 [Oryza meyeriana var. granulata]|uniref:Uncharacterized protein n=1 Tax=Oryza meyeriana var. granulata TaxID=110450 RepID=A0A6G1EMS7_9ORYZ|nr:hypothetical protein E2562_018733 [Oryza meyeriana var. granulata]